MKFVVYEVWTRSRVIDVESVSEAYKVGEPVPGSVAPDMSLCNWHIQAVDGSIEPVDVAVDVEVEASTLVTEYDPELVALAPVNPSDVA